MIKLLLGILLILLNFPLQAQQKPNATFIVPDKQGPLFWQLVRDVGQAASFSLNIDYRVRYSDSDRFATINAIEKLLKQDSKPDILIFRPFKGNVEQTFSMLEKEGISFITIENAFDKTEAELLQKPRQRFKHWLGEVTYDNISGGKMLLHELVRQQQSQNPNTVATIVGLGGDFDKVSIDRQRAIETAEADLNQFNLRAAQIFPMYWDPNKVKQLLPRIIDRYPSVNVVWTAGDQMAYEVIRSRKLFYKKPLYIGGFDWLPETFQKIKNKEMTASVGGHFLLVAQALIKYKEMTTGKHPVPTTKLFQYEMATAENVDEYIQFFENKLWRKVDYNRFLSNSKPKLELSVKNIIKLANNKVPN